MRILSAVALGLALVSCAHKPPPPPPAPPPPPPPPAGDLLRLGASPGAETHAQVNLTVETDVAGGQGARSASRHLALGFDFTDQEKVEAVGPDGTMSVTAHLLDAVGHVSAGGSQQMVDNFALALDDLTVRFRRTPRGEVDALQIDGVHPPLEPQTARTMLNALYLAQRGPLFSDKPVPVGGTWTIETAVPPSSGFHGMIKYLYTYLRDSSGVAMVSCDGTVTGKGAGGTEQHLDGQSSTTVRFERDGGRLLSSTVDATTQIGQVVPAQQAMSSTVKQHVHVEWRRIEEDDQKPGTYVELPDGGTAPAR